MTVALFRLAFTVAPVFSTLTCHYLQVAGSFFNRYEVRRLVVLPLLVSLSFHVLFHSPSGVLFTFPSRYCFAIGHSGIFSLTRWSSQIHTGFHVSHATRDTTLVFKVFDYRIFTFCDVSFQRLRLTYSIYGWLSHNPTLNKSSLGCSLFARRYCGNRFCFLFLWLLRCFNSPGSLLHIYLLNMQFKEFPHSGTSGSKLTSSSPKRFVGRHALHRF